MGIPCVMRGPSIIGKFIIILICINKQRESYTRAGEGGGACNSRFMASSIKEEDDATERPFGFRMNYYKLNCIR